MNGGPDPNSLAGTSRFPSKTLRTRPPWILCCPLGGFRRTSSSWGLCLLQAHGLTAPSTEMGVVFFFFSLVVAENSPGFCAWIYSIHFHVCIIFHFPCDCTVIILSSAGGHSSLQLVWTMTLWILCMCRIYTNRRTAGSQRMRTSKFIGRRVANVQTFPLTRISSVLRKGDEIHKNQPCTSFKIFQYVMLYR